MSPRKAIKFPPLTASQKQSPRQYPVQTSEEGQEVGAVCDHINGVRKVQRTGSRYIYSSPGRKPPFLLYLEKYVSKEVLAIDPNEPTFQELKLQVYRNTFCKFIKEFKTYQPLLSAIRKEYENTIDHQQHKIQDLEPLRSRLKQVSEECQRKAEARCVEEQAEIEALKRDKQQLQEETERQRNKEKELQAVVDRLQSELSNQYLQYREERDARKLLIWQLNDLSRSPVKEECPGDEGTGEVKDSVQLQLALKVCRLDLTKAQEELSRVKSQYWDVVPRRDWDSLQQTHQQTLLQLKTVQGDYDQLKTEYDSLLEIYKKGQETHSDTHTTPQEGVSPGQNVVQSSPVKEPISTDASESSVLTVPGFRAAPKTATPLKSQEDVDEPTAQAQRQPDGSKDHMSSQSLHLLVESTADASPATAQEPEDKAASETHRHVSEHSYEG